jgi:hypothetical protein
MLVGEYEQGLVLALEAEGFAVEVRDVSKQVYAMQLQAQCFFGLDRWDEMLAVEDRRRALEAEYGSDRVDRMCYYCGIRANVLGWRGEFELAEAQRQESLDMMTGFFGGPPATWPPVGHY